MAGAVLDASAVIALLRDEPGADTVMKVLGSAVMSAVNLQEVYRYLIADGIPANAAEEMVGDLRIEIRNHDGQAALAAAILAPATREAGSGLGDRSCMALAIAEQIPAVTADQSWKKVKAKGLKVELIR